MKMTTVTSGEITGRKSGLPERKIIREAQKAFCLSPKFWVRVKEGKFPYVFNKNSNNLEELGYADTMASLKGQYKGSDVYWLTDAEYPEVNETLQNIAGIDAMKRSYQEQIEKFKVKL